jgi:hypothetical protein
MGEFQIYRSAFRMSDCCEASIFRIIEPRNEFFVCQECNRLCKPIPDPRYNYAHHHQEPSRSSNFWSELGRRARRLTRRGRGG